MALSRPIDVGALICGPLNDVVEPLGFASGQVGSDSDGSVTAIFCSNNNTLLAAYPGLPVPSSPDSGSCTDLTIETSAGPDPRVLEAHLDGVGLDRLVGHVGRADLLPGARAVRDLPIERALRDVASLVREVFATAAGMPPSNV